MTATNLHQAIHRQPDDLRRLLATQWGAAAEAAAILSGAERVMVAGIGTSYHAAVIGGWLLRAAGLDARAVHAFDAALYPDSYPLETGDAVVVMGHTGSTTFTRQTLARAVEAGVPTVAVGALTAEHPGAAVVLRTVEPEQSTTYTTSHLSAMTALAMVATLAGETRGGAGTGGFREAIVALPDQVVGILGRESEIEPIARDATARRVYAIGAGPNEATATELMIKVREAAFRPIDGIAAEQFLHGPAVAVNAGDLAVIVHVSGRGSARVAEIGRTLAAIGARLWVVGQAIDGVEATTFALPETPELMSPLLAVVPMQLLASQMADRLGTNPDEFRQDDPVYDRAFNLLRF